MADHATTQLDLSDPTHLLSYLGSLELTPVAEFGVDSGQYVIVSEPAMGAMIDEPFIDKRVYLTRDGRRFVFPDDFSNYNQVLEAFGKSVNELIRQEILKPHVEDSPTQNFSYNGASQVSLNYPAGLLLDASNAPVAAVAGTMHGDGIFPVFALGDLKDPAGIWVDTDPESLPTEMDRLLHVGDITLTRPQVTDPCYLAGSGPGMAPVADLSPLGTARWRIIAGQRREGRMRTVGLLMLPHAPGLRLPPLDTLEAIPAH